jgi:hypothetical protein
MALSVSLTGDWMTSVGNRRQTHGTITLDSSYATGGETLAAADVGLGVLDSLQLNQGEDGYVFHWDKSNGKVMAFYGDNDAGADGVLAQVASTVDLSAVVIEFVATGS